MKKYILMTVAVIFTALNAQAFEGVLRPQLNGDVVVQQVKTICEEQPPMAGENGVDVICRPADGKHCAPGYKRMHKYCWGGLNKGLYRCGYVCEKVRDSNDGNGGPGGDFGHD
ncbi:MAG: hypothetical protein J7501_15815 [Bdellovibrio sp.]|nr:hypothetical protein [Bdellovibrio sp.]